MSDNHKYPYEAQQKINDLERQLAEARKSLGDSINYRVFNLNADEAIKALRHTEQLKEQG